MNLRSTYLTSDKSFDDGLGRREASTDGPSFDLEERDNEQRDGNDAAGFHSKDGECSFLDGPRDLEVSDRETTENTKHCSPASKVSLVVWEAVGQVARNTRDGKHDATHVKSPAHANTRKRVMVLERRPEDEETWEGEEDGGVEDRETTLGFKDAVVLADVPVFEPRVCKVANQFSQEGSDDRREVKQADGI